MPRADLLALSEDGLVQLANAGLVKRGLRDLASGQGPVLTEMADGGIEACFADGTLTRLPAGRSPGEASCTCPASGMCRHRVSLVLAYRQNAAAETCAAPSTPWDPGTLDVEALEASWTAAGRNAMKRLRAVPLTVTLVHDALPVARLPMTTVRFLVPGDIAYARCDCATGIRCAHVALAIHAFRAAAGTHEVILSGEARPDEGSSVLTIAVDAVLSRLLAEGAAAGMAGLGRVLDQARSAADTKGATWLSLALGGERLMADAIRMRPLGTGLPIEGVARGQILTAAARRRADGGLMLGAGGRGRTVLMPRTALQSLPAPLQIAELAPLAASLAARAPSFLRPRSRVPDVHVFEVRAVLGQAWAPGAQRWQAAVMLPCGGTLYLERSYDPAAPWALEVLFASAAGEHGPIRQLAGPVRLEDGMVICDPWSLTTDRLIIPDFDRPDRPVPTPPATSRAAPADGPAMARSILAAALHVGRQQRDRDFLARGEELTAALHEQGYPATGERLATWLRSAPGDVTRFGEAAIWCLSLQET